MSGWIIFGLIIYCLLLTVVLLWVMNYIEIYTTRRTRRKYEQEQQSVGGLSRFEQGKVGANKDLGQSEDKKILPGSGGGSGHLDVEVSGRESPSDDGLDEELGQVATGGSSSGYGATSPYKPLTAYQASAGETLHDRLERLRKEVI